MAERKPTTAEVEAFLNELELQGRSSLTDPVPGALAQFGPAVTGGPAALKAAGILDTLGIGRAGDDVLQGMTWRGKKAGVSDRLAKFIGKRGEDKSLEQLPKFLKRIKEKLMEPIQREPLLDDVTYFAPDPVAIRLGQAFWEARRPLSAKSTRELELVSDTVFTPTAFGHQRASPFAKSALESGAPKSIIKSGNVGINPRKKRVDNLLDTIETFTHEGGHNLQFRKANFDPKWYDFDLEKKIYPRGPRESEAFKMGFRGSKDFKEFMEALLTRRGAKEPILKKALEDDPALLSLVEALEKRYKAGQLSMQELHFPEKVYFPKKKK